LNTHPGLITLIGMAKYKASKIANQVFANVRAELGIPVTQAVGQAVAQAIGQPVGNALDMARKPIKTPPCYYAGIGRKYRQYRYKTR
jgi:hypothetical protein